MQIVDLIKKNVSLRIQYSLRDEIRNFWSSNSVLCTIDSMNNISGVLARAKRSQRSTMGKKIW